MDKELKAKWVTALRSGQYKQGKARLRRDDDTYCCLGVLADVVFPAEWDISFDSDCYSIQGHRGSLSKELVKLTGVDDEQDTLSRMNDTQGKSFSEIADYIEANL